MNKDQIPICREKSDCGEERLRKLAYLGRELPDGLSQADQNYYLGLRELYRQISAGTLEVEQGRRESNRLRNQRNMSAEKEAFQEKLMRNSAQMWKNIEQAASHFAKARKKENMEEALHWAERMYCSIYRIPLSPMTDRR